MREMKESGVEWIGEIPASWDLVQLGVLFSEHKKKNIGMQSENLLSLSYGNIIRKNINTSDGLLPESFEGYNVIDGGDIVLRLTDLQNDQRSLRVGLSHEKGIVTSAYVTLRKRNANFNSQYYYYLIHSYDVSKGFYGMGAGVRQGLNYAGIKKLLLPIPSIEEQEKIATFISERASKVDTLITNVQSQIEKLKAYKQSIITEVVTKGLDSSVPMKDSGVEWIGDIPKNWDLVKVVRIADKTHPYAIGDGDHGLIKPDDYQDAGIPYIRVQNLGWATELDTSNIVYISEETNDRIKGSTLRPNDVLFAKTGATIGKTAILPETMPIANTTSHVGKITVNSKYEPRFIFYVLSSAIGYRQFWEYASSKTTRPELAIDEIKQVYITLPRSKEEQSEIVVYLDNKCSLVDRLVEVKQRKVEQLIQYKKSLIYEYVTGKKEVS